MALSPVRFTTSRGVLSLLERIGAAPHGVRQGPATDDTFALTFDDGPHPEWTPRFLDALDAAGARGTFFVVGRHAEKHPEIVRDARKRGHEIGTHLWTHDRAATRSDWRFEEEVAKSRRLLEELLGEPLVWLRYPYGVRGRQHTRDVERAHGLKVAHWTASSHDTQARSPSAVALRTSAALRPGAILLFHDRLADEGPGLPAKYYPPRDVSLAGMRELLAVAKARSLSAVTLSEMFR